MSPSNQIVPLYSVFCTNFSKARPAARLFLAAAVILAILQPAYAVTVTWQGGSGILWANSANWSGGTPGGNDILFNNSGATPVPSNEVNANVTVNSLWYGQEPPYFHTTKIDAGSVLKVQGTATVPTGMGANGAYSLMAGTAKAGGSALVTDTVITGDGTLDISSATNGNTAGDIIVTQGSDGGSGSTNRGILDMSGLAHFNANIDQLLVGIGPTTTGFTNAQRSRHLVSCQVQHHHAQQYEHEHWRLPQGIDCR